MYTSMWSSVKTVFINSVNIFFTLIRQYNSSDDYKED